MLNLSRRIPLVAALLIAGGLGGASNASAATAPPLATFVTPAPGVITVVQTGYYVATWTIAAGITVKSETIAVQTSRPIGVYGCDIRWLPVSVSSVSGTSYQVSGLPVDRCYRFILRVQTATATQDITSPTFIPAPAGLGATADFTNPHVNGLVVYETSQRVGWAERDTFGAAIVSRSFAEQSAVAVAGSCAAAKWSSPVKLAMTGTSIMRTFTRGSCHRYQLTLQDSKGFRSLLISGSIRVADSLPAWQSSGTLDFYRASAFASQATSTWCVAAGSEMMLNMVLGESDSSSASQSTYIVYGQAHDGGSYSAGTNPAGWAAILDRFGGASYSVATFGDRTSALKRAATRMRLSNKPVGLLVWAGRHAWVMNGFTATADPAVTSTFTVTAVFVTGPLYPRPMNSAGYDPPPDTSFTPSALAKYFVPYQDPIVTTWNGKYVMILP